LRAQRRVVDAFLAALRAGDYEGLLAVLDPDVSVRLESAAAAAGLDRTVQGAAAWAQQGIKYAKGAKYARPVMVDGAPGVVIAPKGRLFRIFRLDFKDGKITQIDIVGERDRLDQIEITLPEEE
jgi:RNA polymerase sigma-70 factor (ECF subfamily)